MLHVPLLGNKRQNITLNCFFSVADCEHFVAVNSSPYHVNNQSVHTFFSSPVSSPVLVHSGKIPEIHHQSTFEGKSM